MYKLLLTLFLLAPAGLPGQTPSGLVRQLPHRQDDTHAIALGDVDGDGDLDLVVGNQEGWDGNAVISSQNLLYLNDGTGVFSDGTSSRMPSFEDITMSIDTGDVDGDGDLDLFFGNRGDDRLYLNDGNGSFTDASAARLPAKSGASFSGTYSAAFGDVDGDGDLDLVLGAAGSLYLNDGSGFFTDVTASHAPDLAGTQVRPADVDGDGDIDLISIGGPNLYLNDGMGIFTDVTATKIPSMSGLVLSLAVDDVDGDGDLDILCGLLGSTLRLYRNDGAGAFTHDASTTLSGGGFPFAMALADVDGDGDPDLASGPFLFLNDGTGTYVDANGELPPGGLTWTAAFGDVDGDRDLDLVLGNDGQNILYLNDGSGGFTDVTIGGRQFADLGGLPVEGDWTSAVAVGDVDGDGDRDLVWGSEGFTPQNRLYLNDGTGAFVDGTTGRMPPDVDFTKSAGLGDLDGDGDLDLIFGNVPRWDGSAYVDGQNRLYLNDGTGRFTDATGSHLPPDFSPSTSLALGDVNGDGDLDLVFGTSGVERGRLYLNNGSGRFKDVSSSRLPLTPGPYSLGLGDVDADGDLDLIGGPGVARNDGEGRFPKFSSGPRAKAAGDLDGDGDLDLVGSKDIYRNDGSGVFAPMPHQINTYQAQLILPGDVDGDGDLDLFISRRGWLQLFTNDGAGAFTHVSLWRLPFGIYVERRPVAALADLDGDEDLDLALGHFGQDRVLTNLHVQVVTPHAPRVSGSFVIRLFAKPGYATSHHTAFAALSPALALAPLSLPSLGDLHLETTTLISLPPVSIPFLAGQGVLELPVPSDPSLAGQRVYVQALIVNNADPFRDAHLTGYTSDVIRR